MLPNCFFAGCSSITAAFDQKCWLFFFGQRMGVKIFSPTKMSFVSS